MKKILSLLAFLSVSALVFAGAKVTDISPADLQAAVSAKSVVLLDANGSDSFHSGHIPGAIDYTAHRHDLAARLPADKNALIVAYCANEACGAYKSAASAALKLGYTNVKHFAPGIQGWVRLGAPVEKD